MHFIDNKFWVGFVNIFHSLDRDNGILKDV